MSPMTKERYDQYLAQRYEEASREAIAALIHETQAARELTAACENEGKTPALSAFAQAKRQAVYAAQQQREEASESLLRAWEAMQS